MNPFGKFGQMQLSLEQNLSPSYNLGVLWEPTEDFSFGMVYQSAAKMRLKGKYHIDNAKAPQEMIKGLMTSPTGQILAAILVFQIISLRVNRVWFPWISNIQLTSRRGSNIR